VTSCQILIHNTLLYSPGNRPLQEARQGAKVSAREDLLTHCRLHHGPAAGHVPGAVSAAVPGSRVHRPGQGAPTQEVPGAGQVHTVVTA